MAKRKKKQPARIETSVDSAVSEAFSMAEELKDELQSWYDNLPEAFQNGSKGEALQEAIGNLENAQQPEVPNDIASHSVSYTEAPRRASRRDRLQVCIDLLEQSAEAARTLATDLEDLKYDDDGQRIDDANPDAPDTEDERDNLVQELQTFADECESATSDWESVEFPGMYG